MPVEDRSRFTSAFGKRDIDNGPRDHWGVDFGGPTPGQSVLVKAAADGVVEWIKGIPLRSGPAIGIKHPDGTLTAYLHTRHHKVRPGQKVKRGDTIAETWHTGIPLSNGIHLHFEWWDDYRDHRSVFNPLDRLAQYGWVIKGGRMHDEWDGRATATPTINLAGSAPASTTGKDWLSMATKAEVREIVKEETEALYDRLITHGGLSWAKVGHNGEPLRHLLWDAAVGSQAAFVNTNAIKNTNAEVVKAVASVAQSQGLTPEQVSALIDATAKAASEGADKGASEAIEAGVTVDITATTTANKKEG